MFNESRVDEDSPVQATFKVAFLPTLYSCPPQTSCQCSPLLFACAALSLCNTVCSLKCLGPVEHTSACHVLRAAPKQRACQYTHPWMCVWATTCKLSVVQTILDSCLKHWCLVGCSPNAHSRTHHQGVYIG